MDKYEALKQYFGYDSFREGQEEIIDHILSGQDVMCVMPTGAGKSVCYQIPALLLEGITIVVSPLISLMNDQVSSLTRAGIHAAYLNSSLTPKQYDKAILQAINGRYKIIYVAPERLLTRSFVEFSRSINISMVTVDEAHCVSQWGHDFRPNYLKIVEYINQLTCRPRVNAFTATATLDVRDDITKILQMRNPFRITTGFNRKNLFFEVICPRVKMNELIRYAKHNAEKCGIVYCSTRKNVEEVCEALCSVNMPATRYHAGLEEQEKTDNQEAFGCDQKTIMVATNAFGMGIDKSNVSFVVHYNMPANIENYYQEAGRAGRDGNTALCVLFYSPNDVNTIQYLIDNSEVNPDLDIRTQTAMKQIKKKRLQAMINYCRTKSCLREYILNYFGETTDKQCGFCSKCIEQERRDLHRKQFVKPIKRTDRASKKPVAVSTTKSTSKSKPSAVSTTKSTSKSKPAEQVAKRTATNQGNAVGAVNIELMVQLYNLRLEIAKREHVSSTSIFTDEMLREMALKKPCEMNEFGTIHGITLYRKNRYGEEFVAVIRRYVMKYTERRW